MTGPITTQNGIIETARYVAARTTELSQKIIGTSFPISSLTIFSHSEEEYEGLKKILFGMGALHNENNGPRVKLREPIEAGENRIQFLRIRRPDPERPQVGCNDFNIPDYQAFKSQFLAAHPDNLRLVQRPEYEMIEFFDPGCDVLAYVVSR